MGTTAGIFKSTKSIPKFQGPMSPARKKQYIQPDDMIILSHVWRGLNINLTSLFPQQLVFILEKVK